MEKIRILLSCGAGMSSGLLAQKARQAAKKRGLEVKIDAKSEAEAPSYFPSIDILLLGPHYEAFKEEFSKMGKPHNVPVEVIPKEIYGLLDGEKLIDFVIRTLDSYN
ncbi:PTS sugar transporter subunit IIB [Salipaludibacillus sp. LMS25]|uniref:PTS sugar transporter subunit IIB n=1 Tax=Salipaludibacillus sp. LMS25 TaxID=2924031 RepID=UPI0020D07058|nr:PTS sugar transporter subunit IIB [Salipaludibacillus sp. LMS25]UTR13728.1 PTS sugar transporter subunit IIB [Salipaludibacillus sp. LMS25]